MRWWIFPNCFHKPFQIVSEIIFSQNMWVNVKWGRVFKIEKFFRIVITVKSCVCILDRINKTVPSTMIVNICFIGRTRFSVRVDSKNYHRSFEMCQRVCNNDYFCSYSSINNASNDWNTFYGLWFCKNIWKNDFWKSDLRNCRFMI